MFGFSLFNIVRAAHKVNPMYNACSILNWLCVVVSNSLRPHGAQSVRLLCPWDSPGKNIGVGCHILLQGIFPIQGSNPGLLHCRQILYCLSHQGSPYSLSKFQLYNSVINYSHHVLCYSFMLTFF